MDEFEQADAYLDAGEGDKALPLFRKLAERGRVDAMHSIAHSHLYGVAGVKQDYDLAFSWFTRAAKGGCPQAMYHLGMCNANGYGTPVDLALAFDWYRKSAERGDEDAMHRVGEALEKGLGTAPDRTEAIKWYRRAADYGQDDAAERLRALGKG